MPAKLPNYIKSIGPCYMTVNRNKRSVNWDQKTQQDKETTRRFFEKSDIFIHNIRDKAINRMGIGLMFEEFKKINPYSEQ